MKLDKKALERLLTLNDAQLRGVIESVAAESGLDLRSLGISDMEISSIRKALSGATDEDIKRAAEQLDSFKKGASHERKK